VPAEDYHFPQPDRKIEGLSEGRGSGGRQGLSKLETLVFAAELGFYQAVFGLFMRRGLSLCHHFS
jgi:hypothetical protein